MNFDVVAFLEERGITYAQPGRNVARGNVGIACPFCGDDPSTHLGINVSTGEWNCWRDPRHRGQSPVYLVARLIGCSTEHARELVEGPTAPSSMESLRGRLEDMDGSRGRRSRSELCLPDEFVEIEWSGPTRKFAEWLYTRRGFARSDVVEVVRTFQLRACLSGKWCNRVVFPIEEKFRLVGWTARTISKHDRAKYMTEPPGRGIKEHLLGYDLACLRRKKMLIVVEGPLDFAKLAFYGMDHASVVAVMGKTVSEGQVARITELADFHDRVVVLLDRGAEGAAHRMAETLALVGASWATTEEAEDPGALTPRQVRRTVRGLAT